VRVEILLICGKH